MEELNKYALGEICSRLSSGKGISSDEIFDKGPFPVIGGNGIRGYSFKSNFTGECGVIGRQGAYCGNVRFFSGNAYMTEHAVVVVGNDKADTRYLTYLLSTMRLGSLSTQSAQPGLSVKTLAKQEVYLPSIEEQRRRASILASIEDKIELNGRINHNLEELAQALYKSWFVDYDPFDGAIPDSWETGVLSDILSLKRESIKKEQVSDLPYLPIDLIPMHSFSVDSFASTSEAQSSLQLFSRNDILIGAMRVYFHRVVPAPCRGITRNTCFVLRPVTGDLFGYALMTCNLDSTIAFAQRTSKGSTMPYAVWDGALSNMKVLIPDANTIKRFNDIIKHIVETIQINSENNSRLRILRDLLLPKLMKGDTVFD